MTGTCRLNNKSMRNVRREAAYQCLAIDLAMLGVISKEECEMLIGAGIPKGLTLPNGKAGSLISEQKPVNLGLVVTEPVDGDTEDTDPEVTDTGADTDDATPVEE